LGPRHIGFGPTSGLVVIQTFPLILSPFGFLHSSQGNDAFQKSTLVIRTVLGAFKREIITLKYRTVGSYTIYRLTWRCHHRSKAATYRREI
jgi:hypothetical protein